MKFLYVGKDGGPESKVYGYWLIEWKKLCSIALLKFEHGYRDVFHTHAFDAISWVLSGSLTEVLIDGTQKIYKPSLLPIYTPRQCYHQVRCTSTNSWVFTLRGPWVKKWNEFFPDTKKQITLTNGRKIIDN